MNPIHLNSSVRQLTHILTTKFYALDYLEPDQLSYYKCLHWSGFHLKDSLREGLIHRDGLAFLVCYQHCTPEQAFESPQVQLSFRKPTKPIAGDNGYVIVRIAKNVA